VKIKSLSFLIVYLQLHYDVLESDESILMPKGTFIATQRNLFVMLSSAIYSNLLISQPLT